MRIVRRKEFLRMPAGTVFQKYEPVNVQDMSIKGESLEDIDFNYQALDAIGALFKNSSEETLDRLFEMEDDSAVSYPTTGLHCEGRDGSYESDDRLFLIWEPADITALISRLSECLSPTDHSSAATPSAPASTESTS